MKIVKVTEGNRKLCKGSIKGNAFICRETEEEAIEEFPETPHHFKVIVLKDSAN